jgi:Ca2+-binding RTX toxin-like protein
MTNYVFDANNALPNPGANAVLELADAGNTIIDLAVTSTNKVAVQAAGKQRVLIGTAGIVTAGNEAQDLHALELKGIDSSVFNEGAVTATTGAAIRFSGGGTSSVTNAVGKMIKGAEGIRIAAPTASVATAKLELLNAGTIEATGLAVIGGGGNDRIVNTGTLKTTATAAGAVLIDLGTGDDFYDGKLGTATSGIIKLGDGQDIAFGGNGNETFSGGKGTNILDGGEGAGDTVDYSEATATNTVVGVAVNLGLTFSQFTNYSNDLLLNIENVTGSAFNDTLTGNGLNNVLKGGDGDDTLDGGMGSDTLDGGAGNNTLKFSSSTAATVDLSNAAAQNTGYGTDLLIGIRNLEGGSGADVFTGDSANNKLVGNGGNDTLKGGGGDDTLEGGTGRNTAEFTGAKNDYSIAKNPDGTFTITDSQGGRDGSDTLKDVRFAKFSDQTVALTNGAPTSISPSSASVLESRAAGWRVTTLSSSDPDGDTLTYSLLSDAGGLFRLNGAEVLLNRGLDYEAAARHTISVKVTDGWGGEFTKEITIIVSNDAAETIPLVKRGTTAADEIVGEEGNDQLFGLAGKDQLFGYGGNDKLWGGANSDTLVGGAGNDIFVFDAAPNSKTNIDWVVDFNVKDDTIHLSKKIFSKIAKKGTLSKGAFVIGDHFKDAEDRILYHKTAGALFYDPDGTGSAKAVQIATIGKKLGISHKDFYVI